MAEQRFYYVEALEICTVTSQEHHCSHTCKVFVTFQHLLMSKVLLTCGTSWKNTSTHLHTTHLSAALFALSRSSYPRDWRTNVSREALRGQQRYPVVNTRKWNTKRSKTGKGDIVVLRRVKKEEKPQIISYILHFFSHTLSHNTVITAGITVNTSTLCGFDVLQYFGRRQELLFRPSGDLEWGMETSIYQFVWITAQMKSHVCRRGILFAKWRNTMQWEINGVLLNTEIPHRTYEHANGIYINTFHYIAQHINPLKPELNPICYLLALLGTHHFLHVSRIRVKLLTLRRLMSYIYMEHPFLCF